MARILITGGAGFIGSHLVEYLLRQDHEILCLDNYFTGSKANLLHLRDHPRLEMIRHDVVNPIMLEVDQVYHLACPASPVHYQYNPVKTIKTNVLGTLNMLGLAKRVKARILLASTSEVYGDPQVHPQPEGYWGNVNPIGIRSCYDEGKRVAETLMMDYHRQNKVDTRIARIFNTFGPRMALKDGRVISNFIVQALDRPGHHHLRGRAADPVVLLRVRPGGRADAADEPGRRVRSRQPGQPGGVHHHGGGRKGPGIDQHAFGHHPPGAAAGRSGAAAPGHHPGPGVAGLAAHRAPGSRSEGDHSLLCGKTQAGKYPRGREP